MAGRESHRKHPDAMVDETITLLFAGQDTSAATLSWTMHLLSLPENRRYLLEVRRETLAAADPNGHIHYASAAYKRLPMVDACIRESQRLYPVAPFVVRHLTSDLRLKDGTLLPAGALACVWIYGLHRHPSLWKSPDSFVPERWLNGAQQPAGAFIPYASGPRGCVGRPFAGTALRVLLARMCLALDFFPVLDPLATTTAGTSVVFANVATNGSTNTNVNTNTNASTSANANTNTNTNTITNANTNTNTDTDTNTNTNTTTNTSTITTTTTNNNIPINTEERTTFPQAHSLHEHFAREDGTVIASSDATGQKRLISCTNMPTNTTRCGDGEEVGVPSGVSSFVGVAPSREGDGGAGNRPINASRCVGGEEGRGPSEVAYFVGAGLSGRGDGGAGKEMQAGFTVLPGGGVHLRLRKWEARDSERDSATAW